MTDQHLGRTFAALALAWAGCAPPPALPPGPAKAAPTELTPMPITDAEWRQKLTPLQYQVLRREGTEAAGTGAYIHHDADGVYRCAGCGAPLYDSATKFDHHAWPAFTDALPGAVGTRDAGWGAREVHCARCGGHLGHIFLDGPGAQRTRH